MTAPTPTFSSAAFIGGGNMASALISGLLRSGQAAGSNTVVEPFAEAAAALRSRFGVTVLPQADASLAGAAIVVWAVKPQVFQQAAAACSPHLAGALQLSVMAGIPARAIVAATGSARVVRAMPNTPALIGQGMTGLVALPAVSAAECRQVDALLAPTGATEWLPEERLLDAVTAVSGSGPAYVFYLIEAMIEAGVELGLDAAQARRLAQGTVAGAAALASQSEEPPQTLRERVTSKGGTTHAAISHLEAAGVKPAFVAALQAAARRAAELGDEFGTA